ncbi:secreted protein [Melampsora americana]|nr:secreted protein [Melampsora americana]
MKSFVFLGCILQVLLIMGYPDSIDHLERRDLTDSKPDLSTELIKRRTSPPNVIVCNTETAGVKYSDMRDVNKVITFAVQNSVPCAYIRSALFIVYDDNFQPAAFRYSTAANVKNWVGSSINDGSCTIQRPVIRNTKPIASSPDDGLSFNLGWLNPPQPEDVVQVCSPEVLRVSLERLRATSTRQ